MREMLRRHGSAAMAKLLRLSPPLLRAGVPRAPKLALLPLLRRNTPPRWAAPRVVDPSLARSASMSVIVCTRDRPQALAQCLAALGAQRATPNELLVIDNSADRSAEPVCREFARALRARTAARPERRATTACAWHTAR